MAGCSWLASVFGDERAPRARSNPSSASTRVCVREACTRVHARPRARTRPPRERTHVREGSPGGNSGHPKRPARFPGFLSLFHVAGGGSWLSCGAGKPPGHSAVPSADSSDFGARIPALSFPLRSRKPSPDGGGAAAPGAGLHRGRTLPGGGRGGRKPVRSAGRKPESTGRAGFVFLRKWASPRRAGRPKKSLSPPPCLFSPAAACG